jgi:hypothetical protein
MDNLTADGAIVVVDIKDVFDPLVGTHINRFLGFSDRHGVVDESGIESIRFNRK